MGLVCLAHRPSQEGRRPRMISFPDSNRVGKSCVFAESRVLKEFWGSEEIEAACRQEGHVWRERFWGPLETIATFIIQVLGGGSSLREAVARSLAERAASGRCCPSGDPSAYCQARKRLPLEVIKRGVRAVGERLRGAVGAEGQWLGGRRVWIVDGSTCSMPDTPELRRTFGQAGGQAPGCGFLVAKIVAMFCWATGAVLEAAVGPWSKSELALWRGLWHLLAPGDVVVGDRCYCTFSDISALVAKGCDAVFRLHQRRSTDMSKGVRLGRDDRLVRWTKPVWGARPRGMTRGQWEQLPAELTVRLVRVRVQQRGFRTRELFVATSLLDPAKYPRQAVAELYHDRWTAELRLRDIKSKLEMNVLNGKTPDVVLKEIEAHLLAYNLVRCLMWQAACEHGRPLHRLSFAGAVDRLNAITPYLWLYATSAKARRLYDLLLRCIANDVVPNRPNRLEPRAVKRRPKPYHLLNRPRHILRKELVS